MPLEQYSYPKLDVDRILSHTGRSGSCHGHDTDNYICEIEDLLRECLEWFDNAPISYATGVTHNGIDEGEVKGNVMHVDLAERIRGLLK